MTRPSGGPGAAARAPFVVGLWPRVGASTVAAALHADEGAAGGMAADIAVCAGDDSSLRRAAALGGASVLLVVLVEPGPPPSRARQRELYARHGAVAVLPHVPHWTGLAAVPDEAATVLARRHDGLPPVLRAYASGLRQVVAMLLRGGALERPWPPALQWTPTDPGLRSSAAVVTHHRGAPARVALGAPLGDTGPTGSGRRVPVGAIIPADRPGAGRVRPDQAIAHPSPVAEALDDDALEAAALAAAPAGSAAPGGVRSTEVGVR